MTSRHRFIAAAALSVLGATLAAQQAEPPPPLQQPPVTFKAEVNYVEVDAVVTDQQGKFVRGLTKDDFQVFEDGKAQPVSTFAVVDIPVEPRETATVVTPEGTLRGIEPDVHTNERGFDGRVYVLVLDDLHTSPQRTQLVKTAAHRFIEKHFGANDIAAVIHTSGRSDASQEFTSNTRLLLQAVDKFMGRKIRSATLEKLDEYQRLLRSRQEGNPSPTTVGDPSEMERGFQARNMFDMVRNTARMMTGVRGRRKAMLLISEGVDYDIYNQFERNLFSQNNDLTRPSYASTVMEATREAIAAATRANMSIYSLDPRGLTGFGDEIIEIQAPADNPNLNLGPNTLLSDLRLAQDSLRTLSEQTGGEAFLNTNDFAQVFDRVVTDNSSYYVMGYYPTNEKQDGRFRKLEVKTTRPGLQIRARKGYFAPSRNTPKPTLTTGTETPPELREAISNPLPVAGLTLNSTAAPFKGEAPNASVAVTVQVRGRDLKFTEGGGTFADKLNVSIVALDQQGKIRGGDQHSLDMKLKPETHRRVVDGGFRVLSRVNLPPGRYQLRVAAHETGGGSVGSVYYDVQVPDFTKEPLTMSGIVLASGAETQRTLTASPDPQLRDVLPGPPTTDREFAATDELAFYVDAYDNNIKTPHKVDIVVTVTSEDGRVITKNEEARDSSELQGKRGGYGFQGRIPLGEFAPGTYVLQVQATSRLEKSATASRDIVFRVRAADAPGSSR